MAELKIVIAEDNPLMMELLSSILEEEDGFVVVGKADNGEDAYQMIMEKGPDLVLGCDYAEIGRDFRTGEGSCRSQRQEHAGGNYRKCGRQ